MSVWQSVEALTAFAYKTVHKQFVSRRADWFVPVDGPFMALWWVEAGTEPTVAQCMTKLEELARSGPSAAAFTFASPFSPTANQTAR